MYVHAPHKMGQTLSLKIDIKTLRNYNISTLIYALKLK